MNLIKNKWLKKDYKDFQTYLKSLKDEKYLQFNQKIITSKYKFIGIRLPILRKIAKEILKGNWESFIQVSENIYYEEVMLKGFVIAGIKDINKLKDYINSFVLLIDNWAICDSFCSSLKIIKNKKEEFWNFFNEFLDDTAEFKVRTFLVVLINYYVEEKYLAKIFLICQRPLADKYYVNMAASWLIAECYIKYPVQTYDFLQKAHLKKFVFNKSISKINDSYQVSKADKEKVQKLKNML